MQLNLSKYRWVYLSALAYCTINIICFANESYLWAAIPAILILLYFLIYNPEKVMLFIAFTTPLSLKLTIDELGNSQLSLPTEPLIIILMLLFFLKVFLDNDYDWKVFKHPISVAIILNLLWLLITSFSSTMPTVSFKFLLARVWFVTVFYFMGILLFKNASNFIYFVWLFATSLIGVIIYSLIRHWRYDFSQMYATHAPLPFFSDHGVYAAVICFLIPVFLLFFFKPKLFGLGPWLQAMAGVITVILFLGVLFSFTRAAWLGLVVSAIAFIVFKLRIKFGFLLFLGVVGGVIFFLFQSQIIDSFQSNKKVSTDNLTGHLESVTNISSDVSNTERINRWKSAIRMFQEKPILGWGPGTYMFNYAPFQLSSEMTLISTRTGTLGNAHSEYIGPLAESGIMGMGTVLILVLTTIASGMKLIYKTNDSKTRLLATAILLALITYFVHGWLNDYMDTDKVAIPFFSFLAMLTALDMRKELKIDKG